MSSPGSYELADRLHSAAIHLLRRLRRTDPLTGVTAAQLSALSVLMGGPRTLGELAAAEQVRPPTMTRLVQDLERRGLAVRQADPLDARLVRVRSTPRGQRTLRKGRELRVQALTGRLGRLSAAQRLRLQEAAVLLEAIVRDEPSSGTSSQAGTSGRGRAGPARRRGDSSGMGPSR